MLSQNQAEESILTNLNETEHEGGSSLEDIGQDQSMFNFKSFLWHGGSVWDAWFSCASNQVIKLPHTKNNFINFFFNLVLKFIKFL
jgi:auxin influx carrier (AUX1 LAX family)